MAIDLLMTISEFPLDDFIFESKREANKYVQASLDYLKYVIENEVHMHFLEYFYMLESLNIMYTVLSKQFRIVKY